MPIRRCRSFTILDLMILVAATAFGICLARTMFVGSYWIRHPLFRFSEPVAFFLLPWTLAFLPIRLRRPRPTLPRLMHQPGMAACCAVAVVTAIDGLTRAGPSLIQAAARGDLDLPRLLAGHWRVNSHHIGNAVAAVWLGLALSRRWRPEAGWIDRSGRLLGAFWMLTLLCDWRFVRWTLNITHRLATGGP